MKSSPIKQGKIFFLDYTFNPALRTLHRDDVIIQLRKKQSDVLSLLCAKYPSPVSRDEFLTEVWGGSYVTSQSIAQIIRSLRIILKDEFKNIIVTIPKLGYQLSAEPTWEASEPLPESLSDKLNERTPAVGKFELGRISFSVNPIINYESFPPTTSMMAVSYAPRHYPVERKAVSKKCVFLTIAILSLILVAVALDTREYTLDFLEKKTVLLSDALLAQCGRARMIYNLLYRRKTEHGRVRSKNAN